MPKTSPLNGDFMPQKTPQEQLLLRSFLLTNKKFLAGKGSFISLNI